MAALNSLPMHCSRCKVSQTCPRRGSSPLLLGKGKRPLLCSIVGGYAHRPVDKSSLSKASLGRSEKDGPCLTLADVPTVDPDSGHVYFETTKIFHDPILHPRQTTKTRMDVGLTASHNRSRTGK